MKQYLGMRIVKTFLITVFLCTLGVSYAQSAKTTSIPASDAADHKQLLRAVMNEFYGSFDHNKSCWISKHEDATYCMNPVRADSVSSPDRQLLFVAVGGQQLDENGEPLKSRPSIGVLGLIVLTPNSSNLSLVATNGLYEAFASYGRSPYRGSISVRELGPNGNYGWVAERDDVHRGEESKWSQRYGVIGNSVVC